MMNNNKILTVSYGTFSCTLEGFDDSFGTMKAIAEYFRDLASDDRYFGAEPPQPDAEMLTRIAEREISRRVEAREHEGRIVLSASGENAAETVPVAAPAAAAVAAAAVVEVNDDTPEAETTPEPEAELEAAPEIPEVEAEVGAVEDIAIADGVQEVFTPEPSADAVEPALSEADVEVAADPQDDARPATVELIAEPEVEAEAEAFFATTQDDTATEGDDTITADAAEEIEAALDAAPADSIAAKLQRIRAVVSQSQQEAAEEDMFEDEHAEAFAPEDDADDVLSDAARDIDDALSLDDAVEDAAAEDDTQDEVAAILARFDTATSDAQDSPEVEAVSAEDSAELEDTVAKDEAADISVASDAAEDMGLDTLAAIVAADTDEGDSDGGGENLFDAEEPEQAEAPRRARIIKVKRADIDAALASGELEEVEDEDNDAPETSLSDEEEAELMAELAQVEAEFPDADADEGQDDDAVAAQDDQEDQAEDDVEADAEPIEENAARVEEGDAAPVEAADKDINDDDVSRLMAEAENQMEEPEGSGRRNAFAHLKAAVMAKKADADIGNDSIKDEGAFRSDLASVVKPRRPEVGAHRGERPEGARPAPLKLVAEQRVDIDTTPKGPVRPRRVAASEDQMADTGDAGSFAEYAAEMGAHNLPSLLEAAASYLSFVEGRDQFSRPQLMTKVRQVEHEEFSREDGLRSFGQLLRAGKIEKISGGRFAVTGDIGYRPDQRAAG